MLINECSNKNNYLDARRRILDAMPAFNDENATVGDLPCSFDSYNLDATSRSELRKLLNYISNTAADKPVISSNIAIYTDDRARVESFARDLMAYLESKEIHIGRIYSFTEKNVISDKAKSFCEAQGCIGDIVLLGGIADEKNHGLGNKMQLSLEDIAWERILSELKKPSKTINILFAPESIFKERFESQKDTELKFFFNSILNYHLQFGDMEEKDIMASVLKKTKEAGFAPSWRFEGELKDYIRAVYGRSDLKNEAFVKDLYMRIVKEHYGSINSKALGAESVPKYERRKSCEEVMYELNKLVGLKKVKSFIREIAFLKESDCINKSEMSLHMVFSGNAGTGKTTVAKLFAEIFYSLGIIKKNKLVEVSAADIIAEYVGHTAVKTKKICSMAYDGILFIDEAYSLNPKGSNSGMSFRQDCISTLIQEMENNRDRLIVIFAGYPKEMEDFLNSNPGLRSRVYKTIEFEDYSDDEMLEIFQSMCKANKCSLSLEAKEKAVKKIHSLRYEEGFGNGRSVRNMYEQTIQAYMTSGGTERLIRPEHITIEREIADIGGLNDELQNMIGLSNVKEMIREIIDTNIYVKECSDGVPTKLESMNNNMVFVGNAGTGKSTVARIVANMLFSIGAASSPVVESLNISELVSGYAGDATQRLRKKVNKAMGGVLFIDEIYLLNDLNKSIGAEVIGILLDIMENRYQDITVILAGYEKETGIFLSSNKGLRSRIPYVIRFDDYDVSELTEIFNKLCNESSLSVSERGIEKFREVITTEMKRDDFANGRSVRNIFDMAYRKHAVRVVENREAADAKLITEDDIAVLHDMNRRSIGFLS